MKPTRHSARATRALQKLAEQDPAFAALALWCRHTDSDLREGPAWTDGETICYGPAYEALSLPEQVGLAAHHILHVAFRHANRAQAMKGRFGERYDGDLFNLATDAIVNETLMLAGHILPRPLVRLTGLLKATTRDDMKPDEAITAWDAERLYIALMQERGAPRRRTGDRRGAQQGGAGKAAGQGSAGGNRPRPGGALAEAARGYAQQQGFSPDIDSGAATAASGSSAQDAAWRQHLARALESGRQAGYGIGALGHRLADLPEPRTPWEVTLRGLVTRAVLHDPRPQVTRPSRRWLAMDSAARIAGTRPPAFQPGWRRDREIPRIVVGVDSSGSVDGPLLAKFAAEVAAIAKRTGAETHLLVFDVVVRTRTVLGAGGLWGRRITDILFARDGGTSFIPVIEEALALNPSAIVILTDLEGPFGPPPPKGLPVVWAVPGKPPATGVPFGRILSLAR
ncbi:putative metal-dependent peptidase [Rhodovulum bhavnagarense]|uniref:Putative metal-dependent peptidase n=1 Tax=Rhodovulum bhavnagarense TaxID=992286 RepID=A0A4R2R6M4_9RHOB|nr:VWA-like domain-containing protein [Rhodovulum bhavnagarense]TCP58710.1 putative metal-dependent peptidase [Rhodovulum bhavnagarense]